MKVKLTVFSWLGTVPKRLEKRLKEEKIRKTETALTTTRLFLCLLFNGISTYSGYLMANLSFFFYKDSSGTILTHIWENKGFYTFPQGICPKANVMAWLEFELAYHDSAVQQFNHYPRSQHGGDRLEYYEHLCWIYLFEIIK